MCLEFNHPPVETGLCWDLCGYITGLGFDSSRKVSGLCAATSLNPRVNGNDLRGQRDIFKNED